MSERSVSKQNQEKRWYTVLAPEEFDRQELGETPQRSQNRSTTEPSRRR